MNSGTKRYGIKWQSDDSWAVVDIFTGVVATHESAMLDGMSEDACARLSKILNAIDLQKRERRQSP